MDARDIASVLGLLALYAIVKLAGWMAAIIVVLLALLAV